MAKQRVLAASLAGNLLEFYDFSLYGIFAPFFAIHFFPNTNPSLTLLASLATFAVGFFMRPLGGIIFGYIGDQAGRKVALTLSIILMAIPTLIVGVLPTYSQIGIMAPIILIACRLLQGLCAGGEYSGSSIFLIEHLGIRVAGFAGALISVSGAVGALLASSMGIIALQSNMPMNAWRIPFLLGAGLGLIGLYIRKSIAETPEFIEAAKTKSPLKTPLAQIWHTNRRSVFLTAAISAFSGALSYMVAVYMNVYLHKVVGFLPSHALFFNSFGLLMFIILCVFAGWVSDRMGHLRVMMVGALGILVSVYPIFQLLHQGNIVCLVIAQVWFCVLAAAFIAPENALMNTLFPVKYRYRGIALGYGVGNAICGGSMPFICTLLIELTHNTYMPAIYLMACATLGLAALIKIAARERTDISLGLGR